MFDICLLYTVFISVKLMFVPQAKEVIFFSTSIYWFVCLLAGLDYWKDFNQICQLCRCTVDIRRCGWINSPLCSSVDVLSDRPPAPVNVSVMHLRADSATVSWDVPEGDIIIGFSISQQVSSKLRMWLKETAGKLADLP